MPKKKTLREEMEDTVVETGEGVVTILQKIRSLFWYILIIGFLLTMFYILAPRAWHAWFEPKGPPVSAVGLAPGAFIDRTFSLTDQHGKTIVGANYEAVNWVVFFGFTQCPDICPVTLSRLSALIGQMQKADRLQVFFITVDPDRDTPEALADYMKAFDPRIEALTGSDVILQQIQKNFHVYSRKVQEPGETRYTMDHTATVFLLNTDGTLAGTLSTDEPDDIALGKLKHLVGEK